MDINSEIIPITTAEDLRNQGWVIINPDYSVRRD